MDEILKRAVANMETKHGGTVISKREISLGKATGTEIIKVEKETGMTMYLHWRFLIIGHRMYQIDAVGIGEDVPPAHVKKLMDSFQFLD